MYVLAGTPNMYSKPRLLMTSTMKSEPGFSMVFASSTTSAAGAAAGLARIGAVAFVGAGGACWAPASPGLVTAKAALAAAVFKKLRRSTDFDFAFLAMEAAPPAPCNIAQLSAPIWAGLYTRNGDRVEFFTANC